MKEETFSIEYSWKSRARVDDFGDSTGWPMIMQGLFAFSERYEGWFSIQAGRNMAKFALSPDLETIFSDLPRNLSALQQEGVCVELDMFEEGTAVRILLQRVEEQVHLQFRTAPGSGEPYQLLSQERIAVSARAFFKQWRTFLLAILDAICECISSISEDEEFISYRSAISDIV